MRCSRSLDTKSKLSEILRRRNPVDHVCTFSSKKYLNVIFPLQIMSIVQLQYCTYGRIVFTISSLYGITEEKKKVFLSTSQLKRFSRSLDTKKMLRKYVIKKYTIKGVIESSQQRRITPQYIYLLFGYFSLGKTSLICFIG